MYRGDAFLSTPPFARWPCEEVISSECGRRFRIKPSNPAVENQTETRIEPNQTPRVAELNPPETHNPESNLQKP
jgi:hypothetical protein